MGDIAAGLLTGLSLIIAIGAQNAFVLRQGLRRSHVGLVVAICALSDVVLILAGVAGIGVVVDEIRDPTREQILEHMTRLQDLAAARTTRA